MQTNEFYFFYRGPLSQWAKSDFVIRGTKYNCAEQYMMAQKAALFNDAETHEKIMAFHHPRWIENPREYQYLGRQVFNFEKEKWDAAAKDIVYEGNLAKFSQNNDLKEFLLATTGEIVEASPVDKIWGVGLPENSALIHDKKNWRGTNWLGEILTKVREDLR